MIAKLFDIKKTKNKGKGLFAKKFIPKGTIVCFECNNCKLISDEYYDALSKKEKKAIDEYAYYKEDDSYIMPCDDTKILNHSCNSNILDSGKGFDIVVKDIQKGEEATYDYRAFYSDFTMPCNCGEDDCCGIVNCKSPNKKVLKKIWLKKVKSAIKLVNTVEQPLKKELKQKSIILPF